MKCIIFRLILVVFLTNCIFTEIHSKSSANQKIYEAENSRPNLSVEETIERLNELREPDGEIIRNGTIHGNAETEIRGEQYLFTKIPDYHRDYNQVIIDPPFATIAWTIKGTVDGEYAEAHGCSIAEVNEEGKIQRAWMYVDPAQKLFTLLVPKKQ